MIDASLGLSLFFLIRPLLFRQVLKFLWLVLQSGHFVLADDGAFVGLFVAED